MRMVEYSERFHSRDNGTNPGMGAFGKAIKGGHHPGGRCPRILLKRNHLPRCPWNGIFVYIRGVAASSSFEMANP